jgi:SAM-dependent methyltransferase
MSTKPAKASPVASHYDVEYYQGHFKGILEDDQSYKLLSLYWRDVLFERNGLDVHARVLDYGSGIGQVSAALSNSVCFDISSAAIAELKKRGRAVIERCEDIPRGEFDYLLSSHSLEHSTAPFEELVQFRKYMCPTGKLVLVLPIERSFKPALKPDWDQHLQCWTFQSLTNLLIATGWTPISQSIVYGPYFLRTAGRSFSAPIAVAAARFFGRIRRGFPSMLTIARLSTGS